MKFAKSQAHLSPYASSNYAREKTADRQRTTVSKETPLSCDRRTLSHHVESKAPDQPAKDVQEDQTALPLDNPMD